MLVSLVEILAVHDDLCAKISDRLDLDVGRRHGHHDDSRYAARTGAERDALRMIAGGCADDATLRDERRELRNFVISAADFEREDG